MVAKKRAVTLVEMMVVVAIVGAFVFIAIPSLNNFFAVYHQQANAVARQIVTDLRWTRTLAITNAVSHPAGYSLQMVGSSPYTSYQVVDVNSGTAVASLTIGSPVSCTGGSIFTFGPLGNLLTGSSTTPITVSYQSKTYTITIISATGIAKCTGG